MEVKPQMRLTGWIVFFSLVLALSILLGCTREVVKEVVVTPVPGPTATPQPEATEAPTAATAAVQPEPSNKVYRVGISEDLTTTNYWAYLGPDNTV